MASNRVYVIPCNSREILEFKAGVIELRIYPYDTWYAHISKDQVIVEKNTARVIIPKQEFDEKFILRE